MHIRLFIIPAILIAPLLIPSSVSAATQKPPQAPAYQGVWQKMTLRDLLRKKMEEMPSREVKRVATPTPIKKITPTPTGKLSAPIPTPTNKPVTPTPTKTQSPTTPPAVTTDVMSYIMKEINDYRASQGLGSVQTSKETCDFAKTRAQEIATNFNHDGFSQRRDNKTIPYANWSAITENIAMTSNYKDVVTMWKNSSGHAANMRADTPFVCVMQNGNYYAYEGMKP